MEKYNDPDRYANLINVCTILQDQEAKQLYRNYSTEPDIIRWFNILEDSLINDDPFKTSFGTSNNTVLVPNLLQLLRFCFLTRRDIPTITLLNLLGEEPKKFIDIVWKGVSELAFHDADQYKPFLNQLVNQLKYLVELNAKEVLLEYLLFVLHQGGVTESKYIFTDLPKQKAGSVTEHTKQVDNLCKAYQGLVFYVEWMIAKNRHQKLTDLGDHLDNDTSENFEQLMRSCADKALNCFDVLKDTPGVWDIFISKHVQILEHYDKLDEAEAILQTYKRQNADNPNAHKYLYYYADRHQWPVSARIKLLKDLSGHVPSDPLVLELCELLIQENNSEEAIPFLFDLLDDGSWQFEIKPWKLMSELMISVVKNNKNVIQECLTYRSSWWPQYHFASVHNSSPQLCLHKALCCLIMDPNNTIFLEIAKATLSTEEKEEFLSIEKKLKGFSEVT